MMLRKPSQRLNERIFIRITTEEKRALDRQKELEGYSTQSAFLRDKIFREDKLLIILNELREIRNNKNVKEM